MSQKGKTSKASAPAGASSPSTKITVVVAVIGAIGAITAAIIGLHKPDSSTGDHAPSTDTGKVATWPSSSGSLSINEVRFSAPDGANRTVTVIGSVRPASQASSIFLRAEPVGGAAEQASASEDQSFRGSRSVPLGAGRWQCTFQIPASERRELVFHAYYLIAATPADADHPGGSRAIRAENRTVSPP